MKFLGVHHIGISVADVKRSARFWSSLVGREPDWQRRLDGAYLSSVTGYPGVELDAAIIELPGGTLLEILEYCNVDKRENDDATANPGNVHVCLAVDDIDVAYAQAVAAGARPVSPGPVEVDEGPNAGVRVCYLRDPDGITVELFQPLAA